MPQFTYSFSTPANSSFTVTTEDTAQSYSFDGNTYTGFAITGIVGTFNGAAITGILGPGGASQEDTASNGGGAAGVFNNTIFINDSQGNGGSKFGLDQQGLGFRTAAADYTVYNFGGDFFFQSNNTADQAVILSSSNAPCYVTGTLIRTGRGDVAAENLTTADFVITAAGERRPIKWIGHRTMACLGRKDVLPVRIAAGAFGERRPMRDLYVSPAHAIAVDVLGEVLIPACRLINGTTIAQVNVESVTYWHIELDSHDILVAEGLPAESYLDCGNRRFFANAEATNLLAVPDARPEGLLNFCRPFHEAGPLIDLVRARLQDRAEALGWRKVEETFAGLHIVADGRAIRPDVDGLTARFVVPADARDVRLISATSVPAHSVPGSSDDRHLGVALAALTIDDGLTGARAIALDDDRLGEGFHAINSGARWTDGSAVLPAAMWSGCKGSFFLRVMLAGPALSRWIAPGELVSVVNLADRR